MRTHTPTVITEPPFLTKETGYAGFEIPIEIYFKNREAPNHVVFVHDLCLLQNRPNTKTTSERLKFINPNKEFEKCLLSAGAKIVSSSKDKKERSDSPPAKKQKSSSLIPSKDMSNKPSKDFIDVFGAPLVFNSQKSSAKEINQQKAVSPTINDNSHHNHHHNQHHTNHHQNSHNHSHHNHHNNNNHHHHHHHHHHNNNNSNNSGSHHSHHHQSTPSLQSHQSQSAQNPTPSQQQSQPTIKSRKLALPASQVKQEHHQQSQQPQSQTQPHSSANQQQQDIYQAIQTKISCLTDCDRLQKIVDIVEESGEWFNLTSKKFEFDLKRLDKRTLTKIERCLQL